MTPAVIAVLESLLLEGEEFTTETQVIVKGGGGNLTLMSHGLVVITGLVGWGGMKRVAMMKEATFIKALISSLGSV